MRVELLTFAGCPNADEARERTQEAMRLESVDATIAFVAVETLEDARRTRFLGSPSVRVDGEDVEPAARERTAYGLMCRTYDDGCDAPPIEMIRAAIRERDILRNPWITGAVYWLPALVLVGSGFFGMSEGWRGAIWAASLAVMSAGCGLNALRCGRVHCYFTGPFFAIMATVALIYGLGASPNHAGWNTIGAIVLGGMVVLMVVPELILGRYRSTTLR